ncbi:tRNA:m(4)X modification enzyme TRM13 isoform X2 [Tripterygium wilfordii]|uniref:tRNA:m(4)X modification enzyme TRM13 n=1 Tax=Tripterygium wilfordii TaxID=458696 RepID=A0A7J7CJM2_TRIWF|nr:tRNA:m(4)X modification enzyme TRM13 isoform X2 [Tripterygium wilfordii]
MCLARLRYALINHDSGSVEDYDKVKDTSSTTMLIVGNVDSTTMDDSEMLVATEKKQTFEDEDAMSSKYQSSKKVDQLRLRSHNQRIPCPCDPSHFVLEENLEGLGNRYPFLENVQSLAIQPYHQRRINADSAYYQKGINLAYRDEDGVLPTVIEFGVGRGYLTQMLGDFYGITKVFLVERKLYQLKAYQSLRQKVRLILEHWLLLSNKSGFNAVEEMVRNMKIVEREVLGFMCKQVIDIERLT